MGGSPKVGYLGSLIEIESCISLTHSKCWNPSAELKTPREHGVGLGQLTKAYKPDGSIRFDALAELRTKHIKELRELNWSNIKNRPDLQLKAILLKTKDNYYYYRPYSRNDLEALAFSDASYNGGISGLDNERRACKLSSDCDPTRWFGNVDRVCLKSKVALYGKRSPCDINREHVVESLLIRQLKYQKLLKQN